ncbi:MAG: hypothetical protein AAGG01_17540, partial [Planctomycetota bacterium]
MKKLDLALSGLLVPRRCAAFLLAMLTLSQALGQEIASADDSTQAASGAPDAAPPNLVVFMIDDLGWRDLEPAAWASPP